MVNAANFNHQNQILNNPFIYSKNCLGYTYDNKCNNGVFFGRTNLQDIQLMRRQMYEQYNQTQEPSWFEKILPLGIGILGGVLGFFIGKGKTEKTENTPNIETPESQAQPDEIAKSQTQTAEIPEPETIDEPKYKEGSQAQLHDNVLAYYHERVDESKTVTEGNVTKKFDKNGKLVLEQTVDSKGQTKETYFAEDGSTQQHVVTRNNKGLLVNSLDYTWRCGSDRSLYQEYDSFGNDTYTEYRDENGNRNSYCVDEVDEKGDKIKYTYYRKDGSIRNTYDYRTETDTDYDKDGKISGYRECKDLGDGKYKESWYDGNHELIDYEYTEELSNGQSKTTHYNANNEPEHYTIYGDDENGDYVVRQYDMNDKLIKDYSI